MKTTIRLCIIWTLTILIHSCVSLSEERDEDPSNVGATPPEAPKNIRTENVSFFKALIVWDALAPSQLGKKISQKPAELSYYEIEYSSNAGFLDSKVVTSDTNVYNLKNLKSGTRYYISVRAVNSNGTPKNASEKAFIKNLFFTTLIVPRIMPPGNLKLEATDLTIDLTWEKPKSNGPSPEGTREVDLVNYLLRYRIKGNTNAPVQVEILAEALSYKISSGIIPGTTYEVQLASKNELGEISTFATGEMGTKNPAVEASDPVRNLSSTLLTGLDYRISWQPPLKLGKVNSQTDAKIVSYVLSYSDSPTFPENSASTKTITLQAALTTTTIKFFKGGATYYVRVIAFNNAGPNGMSSTPENNTINTLARATAPSPPSLNNPIVDSSKKVVLTWRYPAATGDSPQGDKNSGKIIKYTIEYTKKSVDPTFSTAGEGRRTITVTTATESLPSSRMISFAPGQLVGNTEYLFRVSATNNYTIDSGNSNVVKITTPPNAIGPSKSVITSLVASKNSRSFELLWNAPTNNGTTSDGVTAARRVEKYKYKIYAVSPASTTPVHEGEFSDPTNYKKTIDYSGTPLLSSTTYNFVLLSVNEAGAVSQPSDPSSFITVKTLEEVPGPPINIVVDSKNYNTSNGNGVIISWTATTSAGKDDAGVDKNLSTVSYIVRYTKEINSLGFGDFTDKTKYKEQTNIPSTSSALLGLEGKTKYYVEAMSYNGNTINSTSTPLRTSFETPSRATAPTPLTNIKVITSLDNTGLASLTFSWNIPSPGKYGKADDGIRDATISRTSLAYTVRYSKNPADNLATATNFSNFDNLATTNDATRGKENFGSTTTSWKVQLLTPATTYYYVITVRAETSLESHTRSTKTSASNATPPNTITPISVVETATTGALKVTWAEPQTNFGTLKNGSPAGVGDLSAYKVYYKESTATTYIEFPTEVLVSSNSKELTLTGLKDYMSYDVFVSVKNTDSAYSETPPQSVRSGRTKSGTTAPTAPRDFKKSSQISPTKSSINLVWSNPTDNGFKTDGQTKSTSVRYELEFKKTVDSWTSTSNVTNLSIPNSNSNFYEVTGLSSSTSYDFRLYALNTWDSTKKSPATSVITVSTISGATPPAVPSRLRAVANVPQNPNPTATSIIVEWDASTSTGFDRGGQNPATDPSYVLEYKLNTSALWVSTPSQRTLRKTVSNLKFPYTDYNFRVKALNADDSSVESNYSPVITIKTLEASTAPAVPGTITINPAISKTSTSITIQWIASQDFGLMKKGVKNTRVKYQVEYKNSSALWSTLKKSEDLELQSYTAKGLSPDTNYNFRVKAINFDDNTKKSTTNTEAAFITGSGASAPSEPSSVRDDSSNVQSLDRNRQIAIRWNKSTSGSDKTGNPQTIDAKYQVRYRTSSVAGSSAGPWNKSSTPLTTDRNYTANNLTPGTSYDFQVKAQNGSDETAESRYAPHPPLVVITVSGATAPTLPSNISLIPDTSSNHNPTKNSIAIRWDKPTFHGRNKADTGQSKEPQYVISYKKDGTTQTIVSSPQNLRTFKVGGLLPFTNYVFSVQAQNIEDPSKTSSYTPEVSFATLVGYAPPSEPRSLRSKTVTTTSIQVEWDESTFFGKDQGGNNIGSSNPPKYILQYRKKIIPTPTWIEAPSQLGKSFTVDPITPSVIYQFRVQAVNALASNNKSQFTTIFEVASGSGARAPGLPTNIRKVSSKTNEINIAWNAPTDYGLNKQGQTETNPPKYRVEYKKSSSSIWILGKDNVTVTSYKAISLAAYTFYDFRVRSISFSDNSKISQYVDLQSSIRTEATTSAPSSPSNIRLIATTPTSPNPTTSSMKVFWTASNYNGTDKGGTVLTTSPKYFVRYKRTSDSNWSNWVLSTTSGSNALDYTASSLLPYEQYDFEVKAQNAVDASIESGSTSGTFRTISGARAPGLPSNIRKVSSTTSEINIAWNAPTDNGLNKNGQPETNAPKYRVEYKESSSSNWILGRDNSTLTSYTAISLAAYTLYDFRVRSISFSDNTKNSQYADFQGVRTEATTSAPSAPTNIRLIATTPTSPNPTTSSMKVFWTASNYNGTDKGGTVLTTSPKYFVRYKRTSDSNWSNWVLSTTSGSNALDYTASSLLPYEQYDFEVKAQNAVDASIESGSTSGTFRTISGATAPTNPQNIREKTATPKTSTAITIEWDSPSNNGFGTDGQTTASSPKYLVQYRVAASNSNSAGPWTDPTGQPITQTFYTISSLSPYIEYNFQVKARNASQPTTEATKDSGYEALSTPIRTLAAYEAPTEPQSVILATATTASPNPTVNSIKISWQAPTSYGKDEYGREMKNLNPSVPPKYTVRYRISQDTGVAQGSWSNPSATQASQSYTAFNLDSYKYYDFEVTAVNSKKITLTTATQTNARLRSEAKAPDTPQRFRVSPEPSVKFEIDLAWDASPAVKKPDGTPSVVKYFIQQRIKSTPPATANSWTDAGNTESLTLKVQNLTAKETYEFRIRAQNGGYTTLNSAYAAIVSAKVLAITVAALDSKLLASNHDGIGTKTSRGTILETQTTSRTILSVINTYLTTKLISDELDYILENSSRYTWSISVGDRRTGNAFIERIATATNWAGDNVTTTARTLAPEPFTTTPYTFKLIFNTTTKNLTVTENHFGEDNTYGAIRGMTISKI